jgi:type I restriction enzyme R subunit
MSVLTTMGEAERDLEEDLVSRLRDLKYDYRPDIRDRATLEENFRKKFEQLNRVTLMECPH